MSERLSITVQKSGSIFRDEDRFVLEYPHPQLVPCEMEQLEEEFVFHFDTEGLQPAMEATKLTIMERCRFLQNLAELQDLRKEYSFAFSPDNVMYDRNLHPKVLARDGLKQGEEDFIKAYMAFAGTILNPKYTYSDFLEGGSDLFRKHKLTKEIGTQQSCEEVAAVITRIYEEEQHRSKQEEQVVSKRKLRSLKIAAPVFAVLAILFLVFAGILFLNYVQPQRQIIAANNAYLAADYAGVQQALAVMELERIPVESKYILAYSYVVTEGLSDEQRMTVLNSINIRSNVFILDYWIQVGRLDFTAAIDSAKRLGDNDMLLYALVKQYYVVQNDPNLSGEEKDVQMKALEAQIETAEKAVSDYDGQALPDTNL